MMTCSPCLHPARRYSGFALGTTRRCWQRWSWWWSFFGDWRKCLSENDCGSLALGWRGWRWRWYPHCSGCNTFWRQSRRWGCCFS